MRRHRLHKRLLALAGVIIVAIVGIVAANLKLFKQDTFADTATVTHYNRTTSRNPDMHVGNFQVDYKDAYCVEHDKWSVKEGTRMHSVDDTPMTITESSSSMVKLLYKIVYYGEKLDYGRIPISIAGSYVYTGGRSPVSLLDDDYAEKTKPQSVNAYSLYNYASSHPLPDGEKTLTIWHSGNYRYQTLIQYTYEEVPEQPEMQTIYLTKNWIDKSNAYNTRPSQIVFNVYVDGNFYTSVTLSGNGNSWSTHLTVPVGTVTVQEASVPAGYVSTQSGTVITNTLTSEVETTVTKRWDDFSNQNGRRPTSVSMDLLRDGVKIKTVTFGGTGDTWTHTETGLDEYDEDGNLYTYTWRESSVPDGYAVSQNGNTITNTLSETVNTTVTKVWKDFSNVPGKRPASIVVNLLRNGMVIKQVTLSGTGDNWTHTETGLDKYDDNGEPFIYAWEELESNVPAGYEMSRDGNTITNSLINKTSVSVTKVWDDNNNAYGRRTSSVTVDLFRNGAKYKTVEFGGTGNTWSYTEYDLDKYDPDGHEYVYTWKENVVPNHYTVSQSGNTITNTIDSETSITVTKIWADNSNSENYRPAYIDLVLYQNDEEYKTVRVTGTGNTWTHTETGLPKFDASGMYYAYSWGEPTVPNRYEMTQDVNTITNTLVTKTNLAVSKWWEDDENVNGSRPSSIQVNLLRNNVVIKTITLTGDDALWTHTETDLDLYDSDGNRYVYTWKEADVPDGYEMTQNSNIIRNEATNVTTSTVVKIWEDNNNAANIRPGNISLDLLQNGTKIRTVTLEGTGNSWTRTIEDLPKYDDNGNLYTYTWRESIIPTGYEMTQNGNTITNSTSSSTNSSVVVKRWKDNSNAGNTRPASVRMRLLRNGVELVVVPITGDGDEWSYTEVGLDEFDSNGDPYVYTWEEVDSFENYEKTQTGNVITNTLTGKVSLTVNKVWEDASNRFSTRPTSVIFVIYRNGDAYREVTLNGNGDEWSKTIDDLPKFDENGVDYVYTIAEKTTPDGYTATTDGLTITNSLSSTRVVGGRKTWKDNANAYSTRPTSITLKLYKTLEGETQKTEVTGVTPNWTKNGNEWNYSYENLPLYEDGKAITYSVEEVVPNKYKNTVDGFNMTNTLSEKTSIDITKTWIYNDAPSNLKPTQVTVTLFRNGQQYKTGTITNQGADISGDGKRAVWHYTFTDLDKYDENGVAYNYTITEANVPNYQSSVDGYNITNTYAPEVVDIHVDKIWLNDEADDRPGKIDVTLYRNNIAFDHVELNNTTGWKYDWTDLDANYEYTVKEDAQIPGYNAGVTAGDVEHGFTITNKKIVENKVDIHVDKIWLNDEADDRPGKIDVTLYRDGQEYDHVELNNTTGWSYTWEDLDDGHTYTVNEDFQIPGYNPGVVAGDAENGFTITNSKIVTEKIDIKVDKVWLNDVTDDRPGHIDVTLYRDGIAYDEVQLDNTTGWSYTWDDLEAGHEYSVEENFQIPGYNPGVVSGDAEHGFKITNVKATDPVDIYVDKIWLNDNEADRPGEIDVVLYRDNEVYDEVVLDNESGWSYAWEDMEAGHEYYVEEKFQIPGYYPGVTIGDVQHGFTIENRKIEENPKTFDGIQATGILLAASAFIGTALFSRKRRIR